MTFHSLGIGIIIPTDELIIFFRGVGWNHEAVFYIVFILGTIIVNWESSSVWNIFFQKARP
jgi:hypothetical protein